MQPTATQQPASQPSQPATPGQKAKSKRLMTVTLVLVAVAVIVGIVWLWLRNQEPQSADLDTTLPVADVAINPNGFGPTTIQVKRGQEVTWTNNDSKTHAITADQSATPNLGTPEALAQGDSYTYVFSTAGTYHFYDPQNVKGFTGTVVVEQ